jgi:hypothetical protein
VVPIGITRDWNLIVRTIVPLIWQPEIQKESGHTFGLGDINPTFFLSPKNSGKVTWDAGPTMIFPTATDGKLGSRKWNLGPVACDPGNAAPVGDRHTSQPELVFGRG